MGFPLALKIFTIFSSVFIVAKCSVKAVISVPVIDLVALISKAAKRSNKSGVISISFIFVTAASCACRSLMIEVICICLASC